MNTGNGSRISGFHKLPIAQRQDLVSGLVELDEAEKELLASESPLSLEAATRLAENTVGVYALPMGLGLNFLINGRDVLVPMVTEEPSVIAAASNAARLARGAGGFEADADPSRMVGQVQLVGVADPEAACQRIAGAESRILEMVDSIAPGMSRRGGGACGVEARCVPAPDGQVFVVVHLVVDVGDAMGANAVNTIAEATAPMLAELAGGQAHLRILSNLTDLRCGRAVARYRFEDLAMEGRTGQEVAEGIELASLFAEADPYRASTHNKGIMNGVDAVALATGNDWRALEAGAHAYAAREGKYTALSTWRVQDQMLIGRIELPIAVGTVGATVEGNPRARLALKLMNVTTARGLTEILAAVGLAQNFGALRALATEGIQRGHMARHARAVAAAAGASPDQVERVATALIADGNIKIDRAREVLQKTRHAAAGPAE